MKIALTGASGLVGSSLLQRLGADGNEILSLSRPAFDLENIADSAAENIMRFAPDMVIHAGWVGTENTERNDARFMQMNVGAGMQLMEIAARAGCKRWIGLGSQAEYSTGVYSPIAEDAPARPQENYGKTKLALCAMQQEFAVENGLEFTWLRLFTCYGKNQKPTYVLPYLIETLRRGEMPQIQTPRAVWDYLHAEDVAEAVAHIIVAKMASGVYNLASGKGVSVGELALRIARLLKFQYIAALEETLQTNASPATTRVADIRKFSNTFNWQPRISLEDGLARCCA